MVTRYPLMLRFEVPVIADGFSAVVYIEGRALGVFEDGEYWLDGVNPGGLTANGPTLRDAAKSFRDTVQLALVDIATDVNPDFVAFRRAVERFFNEVDRQTAQWWSDARAAVRAGQVSVDGLAAESSPPEPAVIVWQVPAPPRRVAAKAADHPKLAA